MKPRVLIFEDNDTLRSTLKSLLEDLGYEVHAFSNPGMCSQYYSSEDSCLLDDSCSDIIISDVNMPIASGIEFIKSRLSSGCKINFRALMSADWSDADLRQAKKIGCRIFHKPFDLEELIKWLDFCRKQIDERRTLADLTARQN